MRRGEPRVKNCNERELFITISSTSVREISTQAVRVTSGYRVLLLLVQYAPTNMSLSGLVQNELETAKSPNSFQSLAHVWELLFPNMFEVSNRYDVHIVVYESLPPLIIVMTGESSQLNAINTI